MLVFNNYSRISLIEEDMNAENKPEVEEEEVCCCGSSVEPFLGGKRHRSTTLQAVLSKVLVISVSLRA